MVVADHYLFFERKVQEFDSRRGVLWQLPCQSASAWCSMYRVSNTCWHLSFGRMLA